MLLFLVVSYFDPVAPSFTFTCAFPCRCRRNSHVLPDLPLPLAESWICSSINAVDRRSGLQASSFKFQDHIATILLPTVRSDSYVPNTASPFLSKIRSLAEVTTAKLDRQLIGVTFAASGTPQLRTRPRLHHISSFSALEHVPPLAPSWELSWDVLDLDLDAGMDASAERSAGEPRALTP